MLLREKTTGAVLHRMLLAAVIVPVLVCLAVPSDAAAGVTNRYCISGNSTGIGWSIQVATWNPPAGGYVSSGGDCAEVPEGADCVALAAAFVECINNTLIEGQGSAAVDPEDPCCFTITSGWEQIDLYVGTAGQPADCEVTEAGCSFNPTIFLVSSSDTIPTLSEWGLIIFAILLLSLMTWTAVRRRKAQVVRV